MKSWERGRSVYLQAARILGTKVLGTGVEPVAEGAAGLRR